MLRSMLCLAVLYCASIFAQPNQWEWLNTRPAGNNWNDVIVLTGGKILLCGDNNTFGKSTDNGVTWEITYPHILTKPSSFYEFDFIDAQTGYMCGTSGGLFKTTNGGLSWDTLVTGLTSTFWYLDFYNADTGYVTGASGKVLKTTNGGATFTEIPIGSTSAVVYKALIIKPDLVYISTSSATPGRLLKSTDYGATFLPVAGYTSTATIREIVFLNDNLGFAGTSNYTILKTTDAGATWSEQDFGTGTIYDIKFIDTLNGLAAGADGNVLKTTDGGTTWAAQRTPFLTTSNVYGLTLGSSPQEAIACTEAGGISRTTDFGATWLATAQSVTREELRKIVYKNNALYAAGGSTTTADSLGELLKSTDNGSTWSKLPVNPQYRIYSLEWVNGTTAFFGTRGPSGIYKTTDGGQTMTALSPGVMSSTGIWYDIKFANELTGFAGGSSGVLCKTADGGATWADVADPFGTSVVYAIAVVNDSTLFIAGSSGKISKSTDKGATWTNLTTGLTSAIYGIDFIDANTGYAAGSSGKIIKTTDGGSTWVAQVSNSTATLYSPEFYDNLRGVVTGSVGELLYTLDGGTNWSPVPGLISNATFYDAEFIGAYIYIAGTRGNILKSLFDPNIPVELISFSASLKDGNVVLNWETATETNNLRFEIERKTSSEGWKQVGAVDGGGSITSRRHYLYTDAVAVPGKYTYRLKQIDYDGTFSYSSEVNLDTGAPAEFILAQNYPNPFNPATVISYQLPESGSVKLIIYDALGRQVAKLVDANSDAGSYTVAFDASDCTSGIYYYTLTAGGNSITRKMMLIK